jgi:hypothetical protein
LANNAEEIDDQILRRFDSRIVHWDLRHIVRGHNSRQYPDLEGWTVTDGDDTVCTDPQVNFKEKEIECPGDDPRDPIDPR